MANGIKFTEVSGGPNSTVSPPSAVIALIGSAPIGDVNTLTETKNAASDAQFGLQAPGFTIPQALSAIRANEPNAIVHVVNVAGATSGSAQTNIAVVDEADPITTTMQLDYAPEGAIVVKDVTGAITYTLTTDYTVTAGGLITRVGGGAIGSGDTIKVSYSHLPNHTFVADEATLDDPPFRSFTPVITDVTKSTTYTVDTDYTIDAYGVVRRVVGGAMSAGQEFLISYEVFDGVIAADIIGTASPRTGMYQYELAYDTYGYFPSIWIAPYFTQVSGVRTTLQSWAANLGGVVLMDQTEGRTVAQTVTDRAPGSGALIDVADERVIPCYPFVSVYDPATDSNELRPSSMFHAGYMARVDRLVGPHRTPGNFYFNGVPQSILGIEGLELPLTFHPNREFTSDVNTLIDAEMLTIRTGNVPWGDRSSAYRGSSAVTTFFSVRRVADIIKVAVIDGALQFIGQPINKMLIDAILQNANAYLGRLVQQGWIVQGFAVYNEADNPDAELALGHLTFALQIIPSIPTAQLDYTLKITVEGLGAILAA